MGTVRSIAADRLTIATDKGQEVSITLLPETRVLRLAPGSSDLKTAQPGVLSDVAVGDRVLATGVGGEGSVAFTARRLVVMRSAEIAQKRAAEQEQWQHSSGGVVTAIDPATGVITAIAGPRTLAVNTTAATIFRRYAAGSARFEDAQRSSLAAVHAGDQIRVRGVRADDGSVRAEEIVSGSFEQIAGTITAVDAAGNRITLNNAASKKPETLTVTPGTLIRRLSPEVAASFAARSKAAGPAKAPGQAAQGSSASPGKAGAGAAPEAGGESAAAQREASDLSQVVSHLPDVPLADLKAGDAVMVVGMSGSDGAISALTVLGGVAPLLAASSSGGAAVALSPWSVGGGGGDAAGASVP